jgi:hypothetical protein
MAKIDVNEVQGLFRVGLATDYKGNEVYVLEILGIPVLYADAHEFEAGHQDTEDWQETFETRLGRMLAKVLTEGYDHDFVKWRTESPTGREVHRLGSFGGE